VTESSPVSLIFDLASHPTRHRHKRGTKLKEMFVPTQVTHSHSDLCPPVGLRC
jgi:hypothetical protein